MHEWIDVLRFEMEARLRSAGSVVAPLASTNRSTVAAYEKTLATVSQAPGASEVGNWARKLAAFAADVPFITWQADFIAARYSLDELVTAVRWRDPRSSGGALAAVQLAEALE